MRQPFVLAIIPARGGSKGIPRKNLREIHGLPLVGIAVLQARKARGIDHVLVSTEDGEIGEQARTYGAEVMGRPRAFVHDNTFQEVDRLLIYTVASWERMHRRRVDVVVLLYPTAPLRRVGTIEEAVGKVVSGGYQSVLSLVENCSYLWRQNPGSDTVSPVNYDPAQRGPRQKEAWNQFVENKAVYVMERDLLVRTGCRLGGRIGAVYMNPLESVDVDGPEDLELCRLLWKKREEEGW